MKVDIQARIDALEGRLAKLEGKPARNERPYQPSSETSQGKRLAELEARVSAGPWAGDGFEGWYNALTELWYARGYIDGWWAASFDPKCRELRMLLIRALTEARQAAA